MVIVKASKESEAGVLPTERELTDMTRFNEEMAKAGVMLAGEGLLDSSKGARIRFSGGGLDVVNGPFFNTTDLVAGFWVIQAASLQEAIDWMKKAPFCDGEVEIRQVAEADDFGDAMTPELRAAEEKMRADAAGKA